MAAVPLIINAGASVDSFPRIEEIISHSVFSKLLIVLTCWVAFYLTTKLLDKIIHDISVRRALGDLRVLYITRLMKMGMVFCGLVVMCLILGLGYSEISVFLSSIFAVVGIALFAQWSILSNITASMIIFFGFPYRVNDRIKILDKDDDMSGVIVEISMFHVILQRPDGNLITYPNTLILQKAVLKIDYPIVEPIAENAEDLAALPLEQMRMSNTSTSKQQA
jgi:small-conductance mechanosensitive channel